MPGAPRLHTKEPYSCELPALALRRHRLPRFWLALTLGSVLAATAGVYWWERQLPDRLSRAAAEGRLDDCLRYGDQLAALSWLPGRSPQEQGRCRRDRALQLWQARRWQEALRLQHQLVASAAAAASDRQRLETWGQELRGRALERFAAGDLDGARALLKPLAASGSADGRVLAEEMGSIWERNRLQLERADGLIRQARWWEALDALNRLDHPWWQARGADRRQRVNQGLARLRRQEQQHDSHGALPHSVPTDQLDAAVQRRIAAGADEWQAFEQACRELGGRIVEAGPESACQR
jgi:hypothetical protein